MRRPRAAQSGSLFRRAEWFRLMSMIGMLVILFMMIQRAREARMWTWLTNDAGVEAEPAGEGDSPPPPEAVSEAAEPPSGPTDRDPDEQEAAREQFSALADRTSLGAEEMPAYWRLVRWSRHQSLMELKQRARRDLTLTHLLEAPEEYRGEIVRLRLHLRRSLSWEVGPEENSGGARKVYEAWGWTDESPNFYCIVFTERPPELKIGPNEYEEVTFYGYFLKLISYRDQQDKLRMAPLLIGRVQHHALPPTRPQTDGWYWAAVAVGLCGVVFIVIRWTRSYAFPSRPKAEFDKAGGRRKLNKWLSEERPRSRAAAEDWEVSDDRAPGSDLGHDDLEHEELEHQDPEHDEVGPDDEERNNGWRRRSV